MPAVNAVEARVVCVSADPSPSVRAKRKDKPNALTLMCFTAPASVVSNRTGKQTSTNRAYGTFTTVSESSLQSQNTVKHPLVKYTVLDGLKA